MAHAGAGSEIAMTALASPEPAAAPAADPNRLAAADAVLGAWSCAGDAWLRYLGRLAAARGPADLLDAGAEFAADSIDICSRVAAGRMGGLPAPLLSDA
jgi:hypothetical protein